MSINYHAYQCRDYLLAEYEGIEKSWQEIFTGYDPARAVSVLGLKADESFLYIEYYGQKFRLRLEDGVLFKHSGLSEKEIEEIRSKKAGHKSVFDHLEDSDMFDDFEDGELFEDFDDIDTLSDPEYWDDGQDSDHAADTDHRGISSYAAGSAPVTGQVRRRVLARSAGVDSDGYSRRVRFNEGMAIYHYLQFFKDQPAPPSMWIPNTALDTRAVNNSGTEDLLFHDFCQSMKGKADQLDRICPELGGVSVPSKADYSYEFQAFPGVKLRLLYWEEDDEFPAKAQILVDKNVTDYVHLETTGCMACDLFDMITDKL